jgi:hypothetical protein
MSRGRRRIPAQIHSAAAYSRHLALQTAFQIENGRCLQNYLNLPVMSIEIFTLSANLLQIMRRGKTADYFYFKKPSVQNQISFAAPGSLRGNGLTAKSTGVR